MPLFCACQPSNQSTVERRADKGNEIRERAVEGGPQEGWRIKGRLGCVSQPEKLKERILLTSEMAEKDCLWGRNNLFSANKLQGRFVAALINW